MLILESTFPPNYREAEIAKILAYVTAGKFCQLVCVPGGGKATLLRLLAHNRNMLRHHLKKTESSLRFIYLNLLDLPSLTEGQITKFMLLALDEKPKSEDHLSLVKQLTETVNHTAGLGQTLVFLFDHFDQYQNQLPRSFFQLLRSAKSLAKYKFSAVFATRRDLQELVDTETLKDFYDFFVDNTVYLKIYDKLATGLLFSQTEEVMGKKLSQKDKAGIVSLTGGQAKLTKVIAELVLMDNEKPSLGLLAKSIVTAALFEIWLALTAQEQHSLKQVAEKVAVTQNPALENLLKLDLLQQSTQPPNHPTTQLSFTIPLFEEFIKTTLNKFSLEKITFNQSTKEITKGAIIISDLLSPQEYRLLRFLVENQGKVIVRDEIIKSVWPDAQNAQGVSDEAIDQMVFRLRKKIEDNPNNPKHILTLKGQGFRFQP